MELYCEFSRLIENFREHHTIKIPNYISKIFNSYLTAVRQLLSENGSDNIFITDLNNKSRDMTKPTKWLCAHRRLKSACASAQSDRSLRCPHEERLGP